MDLFREAIPNARCLEVVTHHGRRELVLGRSGGRLPEHWPVEGPRSALWVLRYLGDAGRGGPESYRKLCSMTCRLSLTAWRVSEPMQMLRFQSFAGTYDQLDLSNLAVIEVIARRVELIEHQYGERYR